MSSIKNLNISYIRYQALLDSAVDGIIIITERGVIDTFNPSAEKLFGYLADEVIGKNISMLMPESFRVLHDGFINKYLESGDPKAIGIDREIQGQHKDGAVFPVEITLSEMLVDEQRLFVGVVRDITLLRQVLKQVQISEERFTVSMRYANIGTWDWNIQTGDLFWSERIGPLFGYDEDVLKTTYENFVAAIHPDDRKKVTDAVSDCVENSVKYEIEHRVVWPDGTVRWVLERGDVVRDKEQKPLNMLGTVQDITLRKQAELLNIGRSNILEQVSDSAPLAKTLMQVALNVEEIDSEMICVITLVNDGSIGESYSPSLPSSFSQTFEGERITADGCYYSHVAFTKETQTVDDIFTHPNWVEHKAIAKKVGLRSCMSEPILSADNEVIGILSIFYRQEKILDSEEKAFISQSTQLAEIVITQTFQNKQLLDQRSLLSLLRLSMTQFIESSDMSSASDFLLDGLLNITGSEYGFIGEVKTTSDGEVYLKTNAITDISWDEESQKFYKENSPKGLEFRNLKTLFGAVLTSREAVICNNPGEDKRSGGLPKGHPELKRFLGIPIFYGDELVGMVGIANRVSDYNERLLQFLAPFSVTYGSIIYAKRVMDREQNTRTALIKAKSDADKANKAKSVFISNMSHELRTPMNAILGFSQLLGMSKLDKSQKDGVVEIEKAGSHLLGLINELLDLSRIESGKVDLSIESINVANVYFDLFSLISLELEKKNISISYWENNKLCNEPSEGKTKICIKADQTRFRQVLLNLLSNAIKYNKNNGEIKVDCVEDIDRNTVKISVIDTGIGLNKHQQKRLFKSFVRLIDDPASVEGTGIGLVITKNLVELMQGKIGLESEFGKGSMFWVEFPIYISEKDRKIRLLNDEASQIDEQEISKILVVEDNVSNQKVMLQQLKLLGYQADVAENGEQALTFLAKNKYACVLTDCNMPIMDGYEFAQQVRQLELDQDSHIPIIAVTANAMDDDVDRCFAAGMDDFLKKPIDLYVLKDSLLKWISSDNKFGIEPKSIKNSSSDFDDKNSIIDMTVLQSTVGLNKETHLYLMKGFLESADETIKQLSGSIKNLDFSDIQFSSHKLKSGAKSIGAIKISDISYKLEMAAKNKEKIPYDQLLEEINDSMISFKSFVNEFSRDIEVVAEEIEKINEVQNLKVLVVDDDKFLIKQMHVVLNLMGISQIKSAYNGEQALKILAKSSFDVMLCDLNMPGMDGVEFLRYLSESNYSGALILISGEEKRLLKTAEELAKAHGLNILGAIEKPVSPEILNTMLRKEKKIFNTMQERVNDITVDELSHAIHSDELTVFYQPQIDIQSRKLVSVEALVRWQHPERGMVWPDLFIPLAEENNLIHDLTMTVFKQGLHQLSIWEKAGLAIKLSLNLSVDSIGRLDLPEWMMGMVEDAGVSPDKVVLELTESRLMDDVTSGLEVLTRLSLKGYKLSIDDFGTGYSSLEQLQRIPFSELKIDRSFVNGASTDDASRAILESSIALAKSLKMKTVGEGVETQQDWDLLAELGCDLIQGYFVAKPMPADEFDKWHKGWR